MELEVSLRGFGEDRRVIDARQVTHPNMKAVNTKDDPDNVAPQPLRNVTIDGGTLKARFAPGSWNVIVTGAA